MLEAVIFDFDGVLVDTPTYYFKHMREYLRKLNTNVSDEDISNLVGLTFNKKLDYINSKYGLRVEREPFVRETSAAMMAVLIAPGPASSGIASGTTPCSSPCSSSAASAFD